MRFIALLEESKKKIGIRIEAIKTHLGGGGRRLCKENSYNSYVALLGEQEILLFPMMKPEASVRVQAYERKPIGVLGLNKVLN